VFTLGTTAVNEPGSFYSESLGAARRLGLRAVLLVGPQSPSELLGASTDTLATPYAPHDLLFPHARAIVHQGGIGTLAEALAAGKPMLIMPYAHDQADNAWRARRLGVARVIARRHYEGRRVARELARLLDDPATITAAELAGHATRGERGAVRAAELIEEVLSLTPTPLPSSRERGAGG
jgi:UDP:flavonoid glycosyltransferase YjiC (YdhE family)